MTVRETACPTPTQWVRCRFEYTDFDLLVARTELDGVRYEFDHDSNLQLTQVTNPQGLVWSYTYDAAGRLTAETDFDGRTLTYTHDRAGRLTTRTNGAGETIRYEHNELGQLFSKDADGSVTTFEYDIFDQLAVATSADASLTWLRDRHGRLRSETVNGRTLTYTHDTLGRRVSRTTPSGAVSTWMYDAVGRRSTLTTSGRNLTFAHDAVGQETARGIGETIALTHDFDAVGRLTGQQVSAGGHSLQHRTYAYRADGNLVGIRDQISGNRRFELDSAGRVTAVTGANWTDLRLRRSGQPAPGFLARLASGPGSDRGTLIHRHPRHQRRARPIRTRRPGPHGAPSEDQAVPHA